MQEKLAVNEREIACLITSKTSKNCLKKEMFFIFIFGIDHILVFSNKKKCFFGDGNSKKKPTKKGLKYN